MMYRVIREFLEKNDNLYHYHIGDTYPRKGFKATKSRIKGLMTGDNATGNIYLEEVKPEAEGETDE